MRENSSANWSEGLRFVQFQKDNRIHNVIRRSPYKAMFGEGKYNDMRGLDLPNEVW